MSSTQLTGGDFSRLFGAGQDPLPPSCLKLIANSDFTCDEPLPRERDRIVLDVIRHIDSDALTRVGAGRADVWERCWAEGLQNFSASGFELEALVPRFITAGQPVRLNQRYVLPRNPSFELAFFEVCRAYYFEKYLRGARSVYEFGCGSGFNLVALGALIPGLRLYGLDWSPSACETVNLIGQRHGLDIAGIRFNFFEPDRTLELDNGSAVVTFCALEQVGLRHEPFLDFLLQRKPEICVNMEPIEDFYDENVLVDYLALRYHRKRGYLAGFLSRLKTLEGEGRIEILEARRMFFGSRYHEGYSFVVWRPIR